MVRTGNQKKPQRRKLAARASARRKTRSGSRWSQRVTRESDALDLKRGVFNQPDPKSIAASLKRSAEHSRRRKSGPIVPRCRC